MNRLKKGVLAVLLSALMMNLSGCVTTVDQLYSPPRRSEGYNNLQSVMDQVLEGLSYCAPISGDNQQTVQMADLTGDGKEEVILFAKGSGANPLKIVVFTQEEERYRVLTTLESTGSAFDQVEYAQLDGAPGMELVVGCQVSDQVLRSVTVYRFVEGQPEQMLNASYRKFLICDLNEDGDRDLLVLRQDASDVVNGVAELYTMSHGIVERSAEANLSAPVEQLKRIMTGKLHGGQSAVFVASAVDESALITDVFALVNGVLTNVSFSNESGTSVGTLRNYYVYADDIDQDGEIELPSLIDMRTAMARSMDGGEHLIRWYAMTATGEEVDKLYTYHNYLEGWYMELNGDSADRLCVTAEGGSCYSFSIWNQNDETLTKLWTVCVLTGDDRSAQAAEDNRFVLLKTDSVVYAAFLEEAGLKLGISQEQLIEAFHLIQKDWRTGEM